MSGGVMMDLVMSPSPQRNLLLMDAKKSDLARQELRCARAVATLLLIVQGCQSGKPSEPVGAESRDQFLRAGSPAVLQQTQQQIVAKVNHCPHVTLEATPLSAFVHGEIRVLSQSVDPDGDATGLVWSAEPDGTFANPEWRMTEYRCASAGAKTLVLHVHDALGCRSSGRAQVTCIAARL
jgi:hypothetical protein